MYSTELTQDNREDKNFDNTTYHLTFYILLLAISESLCLRLAVIRRTIGMEQYTEHLTITLLYCFTMQ